MDSSRFIDKWWHKNSWISDCWEIKSGILVSGWVSDDSAILNAYKISYQGKVR
jgi:hypothetical protein